MFLPKGASPWRPMPSLRVLALGVALIVLSAAPAKGLEILIPRDKAVVTEDTLVILGLARKGTTVRWTLTSSKGSERGDATADWGDLFEIFLILNPDHSGV